MRSMVIVIAHPDTASAEVLGQRLRAEGHAVTVTDSGEQAIDQYVQAPYDLLVIERHLRGRDGIATVESLRWAERGQQLGVVLLDAENSSEAALGLLAVDVDAYATLAGPWDAERLAETVACFAREATPSLGAADPDEQDAFARALRSEESTRLSSFPPPAARPPSLLPPRPDAAGPFGEPASAHTDRTVARTAAPLTLESGSLRRVPFAQIIHRALRSRQSGIIEVVAAERGPGITQAMPETIRGIPLKRVHFAEGSIYHVESNLVVDRPDAAVPLAIDLLESRVFGLFSWTRGQYRWIATAGPPQRTRPWDVAISEIVLRGVLRMPTGQLLRRVRPILRRYAVPNPGKIVPFRHMNLPPETLDVLSAMDGSQTVHSLIRQGGSRPGAAAQVLYTLYCVGGLTLERRPQARRSLVSMPPAPWTQEPSGESTEAAGTAGAAHEDGSTDEGIAASQEATASQEAAMHAGGSTRPLAYDPQRAHVAENDAAQHGEPAALRPEEAEPSSDSRLDHEALEGDADDSEEAMSAPRLEPLSDEAELLLDDELELVETPLLLSRRTSAPPPIPPPTTDGDEPQG